jgi:ribonuclease E
MTEQHRSAGDDAPSQDRSSDSTRAADAGFGFGLAETSDRSADPSADSLAVDSSGPQGGGDTASKAADDTDAAPGGGRRSRGGRRRRRSLARSEGERAEQGAPEAASGASRGDGEGGSDDSDDEGGGESPRRSKGRRRKRRRRASTGAESEPEVEQDEQDDQDEQDGQEGASEEVDPEGESDEGARRKRPRRRGGRRRKKAGGASDDRAEAPGADGDDDGRAEADEDADETAERDPDEDGSEPRKRSRRRGSRGGRRKRKSKADSAADEDERHDEDEDDDDGGAVRLDAIPGEDDDLEPVPAPVKGARKTRKRKSKAKRSDADGDEPGEETAGRRRQPEVPRDQVILVNAKDPEDTRVVVVQSGKIVDLQMTVAQHKSYVNDIYRGRVVNIESAIGAAFVDFGQGRNGFLHASDVMEVYGEDDWSLDKLLAARTDVEEWASKGPKPEEFDGEEASKEAAESKGKKKDKGRARRGRGRRKSIDELLDKGQLIVGQITKDAIGDKGPTLTTYVSIPGRYLVLMPSLQRTGVSRKIEDDKERKRLKRILSGLSIPDGMGVIVRTAGIGKTKSEIKRDLDYLLAVWSGFSEKLVLGRSPAPLYQESDVAIRTMRDLFSSRTEKVLVDDPAVYERMVDFTKQLMPEHVDRIQLHEGNRPLFHEHGVEQDFEKVFARRVELPSGGSIMIDQTEALVAIDVNSGRTRDDGADFEDIALKTNLEAVPEIARQIRLRDMGGIVVIDFIDMIRQASRRKVEKALRDRLADDRARSKIGRISQFGLLEMTRQRLGPGLSKLLYDNCTACRGTGRRRTAQSRAQALLRRLGSALTQKGFTKIEILAHPDTIEWLKNKDREQLKALEEKYKRELVFKGVEEQTEDSIFHYLRADGREVRPGGRRKR